MSTHPKGGKTNLNFRCLIGPVLRALLIGYGGQIFLTRKLLALMYRIRIQSELAVIGEPQKDTTTILVPGNEW